MVKNYTKHIVICLLTLVGTCNNAFGMNSTAVLDKMRDLGIAGASGVIAYEAGKAIAKNTHSGNTCCLIYLFAPLTALCAAKAFTNQTWANIFAHKKTALLKYYTLSTLTSFLGGAALIAPLVARQSLSCPEDQAYSASLGLACSSLIPGSFAGKYLKEVLSTK